MDLQRLKAGLGESIFARHILFYPSVGSTNDLVREMAAGGVPEGALVVADEQRAGRGRRGKTWVSPAGANLLFSVLLRPRMTSQDLFMFTMVFALATLEGIGEVTGLTGGIKWPNDLFIGEKKVGGMLTECVFCGNKPACLVIGLGLNVNGKPVLHDERRYSTTCLFDETAVLVEREVLLARLLVRFEGYHREVIRGRGDDLYRRWLGRSMILGRWVEVRENGEPVKGKAEHIERNGTLMLRDEDGRRRSIVCGDVSVINMKRDDPDAKEMKEVKYGNRHAQG
jgi:BirA family biotin operon repressor/biotin-[acetyl-CoA-carboxylase] ligase